MAQEGQPETIPCPMCNRQISGPIVQCGMCCDEGCTIFCIPGGQGALCPDCQAESETAAPPVVEELPPLEKPTGEAPGELDEQIAEELEQSDIDADFP